MKKLLLPFLVFSISAAAQKTEQVKWLTGIWKINTGKGVIVEEWKLLNDSTLAGKSNLPGSCKLKV